MKKSKKKLIVFGFIANVLLVAFITSNIIFSIAYATYNIQNDGMFTEVVDGHTYKCYHITDTILDDDPEDPQPIPRPIAIAIGDTPSSVTGSLSIPSTITSSKPTGESLTYNVVAIKRAGFAHCDFTEVTIPQTIREINEEAFAYCHGITSIQIPKDVTEIAPSTFIDCRELQKVYYSKTDGTPSTTNNKITRFGDHAFDSCVKLDNIQCPSSAIYFGESCFQNTHFTTFRLPYDNGASDVEHGRNEITIEQYAFANCQVLQNIYLDVNTTMIKNYAFANSKTDLTFYYCGSSIPTFSNNSYWRNKNITTHSDNINVVYNVLINQQKIAPLVQYPGLFYYLTSIDQPLDNARTTGTSNTTSVYPIKNSSTYAVIAKFETPDRADWNENYYHSGTLRIPDSITVNNNSYTVKVIANNAFENNTDITAVYFNEHLVQIQHHAFYHCYNIATLDFSACNSLTEISYSIFNEVVLKSGKDVNNAVDGDKDDSACKAAANRNTYVTSLKFPNCLQYIGNFAFYNFTNLTQTKDGSGNITGGLLFKTNPSAPSQLKIIGDYAFALYSGIGPATGTIDLKLPYSLDDAAAPLANIYHAYAFDRKYDSSHSRSTVHESIFNRYAVNRNAFEYQSALRTIEMERGGNAHETSFGSNAFGRCKNIIKFTSNSNICLIGKDMFKCDGKNSSGNSSLKEVFLEADTAENNSYNVDYPWNIFDGANISDTGSSLFSGSTRSVDLVVYIKSSNGKPPKEKWDWDYELTGSYANELDSLSVRTRFPVHFVDWTVTGNIKYWHLNTSADELTNDGPDSISEYNDGYISLVKKSHNTSYGTTADKYSVARYFTDGINGHVKEVVDLTSSTLDDLTIDEIGAQSFASSDGSNMGYFFVLPTTVNTICERAFFRGGDNYGVRIITFKNGNTPQIPSGTSTSFGDLSNSSNGSYINNNGDGYCCIPNSVTRIEKNAFYGNLFSKIELGTTLSFIGNASFYSKKQKSTSFLFTDYDSSTSDDANSVFTAKNDGIYYTGDANKKVLLHQGMNLTGTMTVDNGTKAIAYRAAAKTKYTTVSFNNDNNLTSIYGYAFYKCTTLTTLNNVSSIKYISEYVDSPDEEAVANNTETNFDSFDVKGLTGDSDSAKQSARYSAFEGCTNLKIDFNDFTSLKKIGYKAFYGCTNIAQIANGKKYVIYTDSDSNTPTATFNDGTGILDLSLLSNLRVIEGSAFDSCTISYAILPNTTGTNYSDESNFYCGTSYSTNGKKANAKVFSSSTIKLCGETAKQADQSGTSSLNPKTHYPNNALHENGTNYTKLYYRVHTTGDIITGEANSNRYYWTAVKTNDPNEIHIILFSSRDNATSWLNHQDNNLNYDNLNRQVHTFPEVVTP